MSIIDLQMNLDVLYMFLGIFPAAMMVGMVIGLIHRALRGIV
jgi:hypothetical protein